MTTSDLIDCEQFLEMRESFPVIDVRAPCEFEQGHMDRAINVPLFDDDERARVGTVYKQQGRKEAIRLGLDLIGPKMRKIVDTVEGICRAGGQNEESSELLVYCARGGMRSDSVCWLLRQADFLPKRLSGGYKSYRHYCQSFFDRDWDLVTLTGMTGSGKTRLLNDLAKSGEQIIDLEGLANHRGSAFGGIGQDAQPTTEQFENKIFEELLAIDGNRRVWVEDESRSVGKCVIPAAFFSQLHLAPAIRIDVDVAERARFLVEEYGNLPVDEMAAAIQRIAKRLGGQNVKAALQALEDQDLITCAEILLVYYDKTYEICRVKNPRDQVHAVDVSGCDDQLRMEKVITVANDRVVASQ